jgi:hypothetical protein
MSPQLAPVMGWFVDLVGGRQAARTLHFVAMALFVLFTVVHVVMVVYAGPINEMRSMISGRFRVRYPTAAANGAGPGGDVVRADAVSDVAPHGTNPFPSTPVAPQRGQSEGPDRD